MATPISDVPITDIEQRPSVVLAWTWIVLSSIGTVLQYVASGIFVVLHFLYRPVAFLLQPVVYLGRFLVACLALPFRIAVKLETIYIYLGVAAILGVLGGLTIRSLSSGLQSILRLDIEPEPKGRSVKQYRQGKRRDDDEAENALGSKQRQSPDSLSPGYLSLSDGSKNRRRHRSLLAQTIMEEEDSDF